MNIGVECGRLLRQERLLHGLTIADVARSIDMQPNYLGFIEKGGASHGPRIDMIARVLSALPNADLESFMLRLVQIADSDSD